jgi:hypothetical protein
MRNVALAIALPTAVNPMLAFAPEARGHAAKPSIPVAHCPNRQASKPKRKK